MRCAKKRFPGFYTEMNAPLMQAFIERTTARN